MTEVATPRWSVHLGNAACTCVRFTCERSRDGDPWPLTRVVTELAASGATMAGRPRALGTGRGIPLVHSQAMSWCGATLDLEAYHLRDEGDDEIVVTLPAWDELVKGVAGEDDVWEMLDAVAAATSPRFGIIGDGEPIGTTRCETEADMRELLRRHTGILASTHRMHLPTVFAGAYRSLLRSGMTAFLR